ncbi:hypothetical protein [Reinekea blandensis]|uniref:Asparagine synthetase domain-containing protein n=1 Tax=Reinekea blandensis MED297 TaxID=314283 RepID=A4BIW2_9GAMM|nr:hypothetical protein [Reinekea blandensis]EAR07895.1 hypothetical protein MED297_15235 [Reinekea sp. MED297] [Reinekea blandensis MED297]
MVKSFNAGDRELVLESDIACADPVYLLRTSATSVAYSKNLIAILDVAKKEKLLEIDTKSMSFLLQSGVVPPPYTIYRNLYILSIGHKAKLKSVASNTEIEFFNDFPFYNHGRVAKAGFNANRLIELLASAIERRFDGLRSGFLYHSAGKDSNSIALALDRLGYQNKVDFITQDSPNNSLEPKISKKIAKKLGFSHTVLEPASIESDSSKEAVISFFKRSPLPSLDTVSLGYPLHQLQIPDIHSSNLIDGMGNDVYLGHIPAKWEYRNQFLSRFFSVALKFANKNYSASLAFFLSRTRAECTGINRMSYGDAKKIFSVVENVRGYWEGFDAQKLEYLDLRSAVRGVIHDQEVCIRKIRNFSTVSDSNLILPWADANVAEYMYHLNEKELFDRKALKNKLVLREMLFDKLGLNSDALGKMAYTVDSVAVVLQEKKWVKDIIQKCDLWDASCIGSYLDQLIVDAEGTKRYRNHAALIFYRLFMISGWWLYSDFLDHRRELS